MSDPHLPAELLDYVVDFLHDTADALRNCCLVSKSWITRTRQHLFASIQFETREELESWKETFPDPSTSPAHYTKTLFVSSLHFATAIDAEAGGWIRGFSRVVVLKVVDLGAYVDEPGANLVPFHGFSPVIKSLYVKVPTLPASQVFDLILSFPLLEDLTVITYKGVADDEDDPGGPPTVVLPLTPPMTGSLTLIRREGLKSLARRLLSLPRGINFQKLTLTFLRGEDLSLATALVEGCSHTLESLDVSCEYLGMSIRRCVCIDNLPLTIAEPRSGQIGLSRAAGLKDVTFRVSAQTVGWVTMALRTITPEHRDLGQISICLPHNLTFVNVGADIRRSLGETTSRRWSDLDRLLVEFWESRSIRPRVGCATHEQEVGSMEYCVGCLLPEITKRGIVDPI